MYKLPDSLSADINYTAQLINQYKKGDLSGSQLKSHRVPMGVYEQRADGHFMIRIRCTGGFITPAQLKRITEVGSKVQCSHLHITTRQEVQIHDVSLDHVAESLRDLQQVGLGTQGGGGNTIRNMLVNELAGIDANEVFDPTPYAAALTTRLIAEKDSFTMPRKLKIAFDLNEQSANFSLVNDFGLIPVAKNGVRGFKAYLGGSVATDPHLGWPVFDFLPARDLFRALKAAKNFFNENGNRKNRHKARIRYIFYKNGEADTIALYHKYYDLLKEDVSLDLVPDSSTYRHEVPSLSPIIDNSSDFVIWRKRYVREQPLSKGFFYFVVPFVHGNNSPYVFARLADFAGQFGDDVFRFTPRQNLQIRNIPETYLPNFYQLLKQLGFTVDLPVIVNNLASCTGADTCRLGICLPKGAIDALRSRLVASDLNLDEIPDLQINMNGCTNACAQNAWTDLGFSGRIGRVDEHSYPAYTVWARINGPRQLAVSLGYLAARDVPSFVLDYLRDYLSRKSQFAGYSDYVQQVGEQVIKSLIDKYGRVPAWSDDKNYYFDWGAEEPFSIGKHGQAECSAGLFDIIELDQAAISEKCKELAVAGADETVLLKAIAFSAARMLLVTRGAEPRTEDEVYVDFQELFIKAGIVSDSFSALVARARRGADLAPYKAEVLALADTVNRLYESMDDSLQFKIDGGIKEKEQSAEKLASGPAKSPESTVQTKDFRGVACPMNFVKTKIALAPLAPGSLLEVWLDDGQPIGNVPGSVRNEGHEIVSTTKVDDYWKVLIRKKQN